MPLLILAALVVVYLILGILYESYIHPITILSTLPSAGVGALAILMLFGFDFSLIALIGIVLLIGIVKKNGIMMVDFAISAERDEHLAPEAAIRKAALLRFRPIMMTTMAAMLGGVPLMLGTGTGSEIRQPLGYAMVGGLIVSQALTLFTTPVVYLYLDRLSNAFARWGRSANADRRRIRTRTARSSKPPSEACDCLTLRTDGTSGNDIIRSRFSENFCKRLRSSRPLLLASTGFSQAPAGSQGQELRRARPRQRRRRRRPRRPMLRCPRRRPAGSRAAPAPAATRRSNARSSRPRF